MLPAGGKGARAFQFGGRVIVDSKRRNRRMKRLQGEEEDKERKAREANGNARFACSLVVCDLPEVKKERDDEGKSQYHNFVFGHEIRM